MNKKLNFILILLCIIFGTVYLMQRHYDTKYTLDNIKVLEYDINSAENIIQNKENILGKLDEEYIAVYILGEVLNPDIYILEKGVTLEDAIEIAGGLTQNADVSNLDIQKKLENKEKINILAKTIDKIDLTQQNNNTLININTADIETLKTLPRIGEILSENIVKYREQHGEFKNISEIKNVDKIGDKIFEQIKNLITI